MSGPPLCIIPTFVRQGGDVEVFQTCLSTLRATAGDRCDVIVVDDGSPESDLVSGLRVVSEGFGASFVAKERNEGFAKAVNVGLRRALNEKRDAILVNADIEFDKAADWLELMQAQERLDGDGLASVVGALLLYPNGTIQHGGIYFSMLTRGFGHIYQYGPGDLPEAHEPRTCPVTGALQLIRHESLEEVGLYDEKFKLGFEDVDYCVRVWQSGRACVYQPAIVATHHESYFRGRENRKIAEWQQQSWLYFADKWPISFSEFIPNMALGEV